MRGAMGMDLLRHTDPFSAGWVTGLLLMLLLAVAWVNILSPGHWWSYIGGVLGMVPERQVVRMDPSGQDRLFLIPVLVGVLAMALLFWQLDAYVRQEGPRSYLFWSGTLAMLLVVHLIAVRVLAAVVRDGGVLAMNTRKGLRSFVVAGLLLLPVLLLVAYRPEWRKVWLIVGCSILVVALLYRWVQAVRTGWDGGVPLRFIMIYLCAAEIVPVLLVAQALRPPVRALFNL